MSVGTRRTSQEASPTEREWGLETAAAEGPTATPGTCSHAPVTKWGKGDIMTQRVLPEGTLKTKSSTFPLFTEGRGHGCHHVVEPAFYNQAVCLKESFLFLRLF